MRELLGLVAALDHSKAWLKFRFAISSHLLHHKPHCLPQPLHLNQSWAHFTCAGLTTISRLLEERGGRELMDVGGG